MDWWLVFKEMRRVLFAFLAIACLAWAVSLSIYLSKEWVYLNVLQRSIVLAVIGVNGMSAVLLYLMIVVVFRMLWEFLRLLFLLAIHVGTAVPFTIFGIGFSCKLFDTQATCKIVELAFFVVVWGISGLLFGYTVFLCVMTRVPRPFPLLTPNELIAGAPSLKRTTSLSSPMSRTYILPKKDITSPTSWPPTPTFEFPTTVPLTSGRTVPKRLFIDTNAPPRSYSIEIDNGAPAPVWPPNPALSASAAERWPFAAHRSSTRASVYTSKSFASTTASPGAPPAPPGLAPYFPARSLSYGAMQPPSEAPRAHPAPLLLSSDPFVEPLSRNGTPPTASSSQWSVAPSSTRVHIGHVPAHTPSPASGSPPPGARVPRKPLPPGAEAYLGPASNTSIHSLEPSVYSTFTDADAPSVYSTVTDADVPGPPALPSAPAPAVPLVHPLSLTPRAFPAAPPHAHVRTASDTPLRTRAPNAGPPLRSALRARTEPANAHPYPYYGRDAEIRRYASAPHTQRENGGQWKPKAGAYGQAMDWREMVSRAAAAGRVPASAV